MHRDALLAQRLGKMAHGAEDQNDLLRVMRYMTGLLHHLGQQNMIMYRVDIPQDTKTLGELIAQEQNQTARNHHSTTAMFGWRRR